MNTNKATAVFAAIFTLFLFATIQSCVDHTLPEISIACDHTVSYISEVRPITDTNCAITGCHNGDNGAERNWTVFSNFQSHSADVRRRIQLPATDGDHMPASGSITEDEIQTIVCWVDQGAKNN